MTAAERDDEGPALDDLGTASGAPGVTIGGYEVPPREEPTAFKGLGQRSRGLIDRKRQTHRPASGRWRAHLHGFSCLDCGATTTVERSEQATHDRWHREYQEFRAKLNADMIHLAEAMHEIGQRNAALEIQLEAERRHNDACLVLMSAALRGNLPESDEVLAEVVKGLLIGAGVLSEGAEVAQ